MFIFTREANPNYTGQRNVVPTVTVVTCGCGSRNIDQSYTFFGGEVDGKRLTCRACGATDTI